MEMQKTAPLAGLASLGAGFIHAMAAGTHSEHFPAAITMGALAIAQIVSGIYFVSQPTAFSRFAIVAVNLAAIGGWIATRTTGIDFISGLEVSESIQTADALAASLALIALITSIPLVQKSISFVTMPFAATISLVLVAPGAIATVQHQHDHGDGHGEELANWPRPYFPGLGIDISNVEGVTSEQEERARQLVVDTQRELVRWADYRDAIKEGWVSIGDQATGYEHFVNGRSLNDGRFLDATVPESIVYKVYGDKKILVSAMYMAEGDIEINEPALTNYAGPLMQWHVHDNLCWSLRDGVRFVAGVTDANGQCPPGSVRGGITKPMVHVWIVPHPCGPFAAVEGLAEGRAAVPNEQRVDTCTHEH